MPYQILPTMADRNVAPTACALPTLSPTAYPSPSNPDSMLLAENELQVDVIMPMAPMRRTMGTRSRAARSSSTSTLSQPSLSKPHPTLSAG